MIKADAKIKKTSSVTIKTQNPIVGWGQDGSMTFRSPAKVEKKTTTSTSQSISATHKDPKSFDITGKLEFSQTNGTNSLTISAVGSKTIDNTKVAGGAFVKLSENSSQAGMVFSGSFVQKKTSSRPETETKVGIKFGMSLKH